MHPPPPSSIHPYPAHCSLHPALCNNLNNIWTKILSRNWAISPNLGWKITSYQFCLKIDAHSISSMLIPNPDLDFWNSDTKIRFWANLGPKTQSCPFCLKTGISRMLVLILTLVFWISNPNFLFFHIWSKKVKVVSFNWKLVPMISRGCWFLFQHWFYEFPTLNFFLGKFGPKKSNLSILLENWHTWYLEDIKITFLIFKS